MDNTLGHFELVNHQLKQVGRPGTQSKQSRTVRGSVCGARPAAGKPRGAGPPSGRPPYCLAGLDLRHSSRFPPHTRKAPPRLSNRP
jgi:hypothetical protein